MCWLPALIRACHKVQPHMQIYMAGAMPRPDKEDLVTEHFKQENETMKKICKDLKKFQQIPVKFIGAYKIFLENYRYYNEVLHGMSTGTRVIRPIPKFYVSHTDPTLDANRADKLYNYILQHAGKEFTGKPRTDLPLVVEDAHFTDSKYPEKARYYKGQLQSKVMVDIPYRSAKQMLIQVSPKEQVKYEGYGSRNRWFQAKRKAEAEASACKKLFWVFPNMVRNH